MSARTITGILLIVTLLVWAIWDVYAFLTAENSTISVVITDWSRQAPGIGVLFGILIGHWFFPAKGSEDE